jgi:porin
MSGARAALAGRGSQKRGGCSPTKKETITGEKTIMSLRGRKAGMSKTSVNMALAMAAIATTALSGATPAWAQAAPERDAPQTGAATDASSNTASAGLAPSVPADAANPAQVGQAAPGNLPANTISKSEHDARIDALRFRSVIPSPSVSDTVLGDIGGWRSTLADYGFGLTGVISGSFAVNALNEPRSTYGTHRYVGQQSELDTSNNYLALTYDLSHIGDKGGMLTVMGCASGSTAGTYTNSIHMCQAYLDQELGKHWDVQVGYIQNSFQYINIYVGGTLSSGTLGPNASLPNELGASGIGVGAPTVNVTYKTGNFYNKFGVQRSVFKTGVLPETATINPSGTDFSEPGERVLFTDEIGYRQLSAPGKLNTWVRLGGIYNTTRYTRFDGGTEKIGGLYLLADHQLSQVDDAHPRRGFYLGGTYMRAPKAVVTYWQYGEARAYYIGPVASRPQDQISFVANLEDVSPGYLRELEKKGYGVQSSIYNLTLSYSYHVAHGIFFSGGVGYTIHPSAYYDDKQGNPLLLRGVLTMYL